MNSFIWNFQWYLIVIKTTNISLIILRVYTSLIIPSILGLGKKSKFAKILHKCIGYRIDRCYPCKNIYQHRRRKKTHKKWIRFNWLGFSRVKKLQKWDILSHFSVRYPFVLLSILTKNWITLFGVCNVIKITVLIKIKRER